MYFTIHLLVINLLSHIALLLLLDSFYVYVYCRPIVLLYDAG